jgi:xanthine/uracil permease
LPELHAQVVPWLRPLFGLALTLATVLAVVLDLLLRVGGVKTTESANSPSDLRATSVHFLRWNWGL